MTPAPEGVRDGRRRGGQVSVLLSALMVAVTLWSGPVVAATDGCITDHIGEVPAAADILEACVISHGATVTFTMALDASSDDSGDPAWSRVGTFATWGLDAADGTVVVAGVESDGVLRGSVVDSRSGTETCIELDAVADEGRIEVRNVPATCLVDGLGVSLDATFRYDVGDDDVVLGDTAPDDGSGLRGAPDPLRLSPARISGPSRTETAIAIARTRFPAGADTVYLARSDDFADAVVAGTLTGGPILLVPTCGDLPVAVAAELERLEAEEVVALGGPSAVCEDLLRAAADDIVARRLQGADRIATAVAVARESFPATADAVYLVSAQTPTDAIAAGSLIDGPMLLVPSCGTVPSIVVDAVQHLAPQEVVALGGPEAVCESTLIELAERADADAERVAGRDRIATAAAIAVRAFPAGAATLYLGRADVLADVVASGSLTDGPVLLVPSCGGAPPAVRDVAEHLLTPPDTDDAVALQRVVALGGEQAVCSSLLREVAR